LATFCESRSVGSLKFVTCINEFCGCSLDVDLIVSQEATGKIDLSCISVWDGTGSYYCQQIVVCLSSKRYV